MTSMRPSRVLRKLRAGELVSCFRVDTHGSAVIETVARAGFDCVWIDMEHVAVDWSEINQKVIAAKLHDMDTMIRTARRGYADYIQPLELDASGLMVPHVMSGDDCMNVVRMTRFHPLGRRPIDGGADAAYGSVPLLEYVTQANEQRFIAVQIEDPEALDELEAICRVDGVDMIFFGALDFSHGAGVVGQFDHPKVNEARERVASVAVANGKFAGTFGTPQQAQDLMSMGYTFINFGDDLAGVSKLCEEIMAELNKDP